MLSFTTTRPAANWLHRLKDALRSPVLRALQNPHDVDDLFSELMDEKNARTKAPDRPNDTNQQTSGAAPIARLLAPSKVAKGRNGCGLSSPAGATHSSSDKRQVEPDDKCADKTSSDAIPRMPGSWYFGNMEMAPKVRIRPFADRTHAIGTDARPL